MGQLSPTDQAERSVKANQRNALALKLLIMPIEEVHKAAPGQPTSDAEPGKSTNVTEDPFLALTHEGRVIEPPFNMLSLAILPEQNTELTPVIETMEQNIEGFGHQLQPRIDLQKVADENVRARLEEQTREEKVRLINFFNYANIKESFTELRKRRRKDLEATGNAYWEVIRNAAGDIQGFEHIPSFQMRLGRMDDEQIKVEIPVLEMKVDGSWEVATVECWQKYRQFVQSRLTPMRGLVTISHGGFKVRWYKEFGDPRPYDNRTGTVIDKEKLDAFIAQHGCGTLANEIIHFKMYSCRSPYGLPRYIGNLLSVFGARAAEEINYITFRNNNIPSMAILVSNGQLTEGTLKRIESFVESQISGSDNYSKFLLLEAESALEGEDGGQIKMEIKPLVEVQHKDALFQNYTAGNQDNVRRSFRIPPIFVGKSEDYTRATADASRRLADEQVFAPERASFDEWINRTLFPHMGVRYHRYKSNSPNTTDNQQLVKILATAEKTGGMTPEIARIVLIDILGRELPDFPTGAELGELGEFFNPKLPFSLAMAQAVKNMAQPTEPGQQVTAVKVLEKHLQDVWGEDFDPEESMEALLMPVLSKMRRRMEAQYERSVSETIDTGEL